MQTVSNVTAACGSTEVASSAALSVTTACARTISLSIRPAARSWKLRLLNAFPVTDSASTHASDVRPASVTSTLGAKCSNRRKARRLRVLSAVTKPRRLKISACPLAIISLAGRAAQTTTATTTERQDTIPTGKASPPEEPLTRKTTTTRTITRKRMMMRTRRRRREMKMTKMKLKQWINLTT